MTVVSSKMGDSIFSRLIILRGKFSALKKKSDYCASAKFLQQARK